MAAGPSGLSYSNSNFDDEKGLFPPTLNLATLAKITTNATCGEQGPEVFCKLVEHVFMREPQCGVCDNSSTDPKKRHVITNAIDGSNDWWQSPTLQNGKQFEWVTVTLDLRQAYQVAYVIVKTANSPRPGNWILERSLDGVTYRPWQFFATSDAECLETYGIRPTVGIPRYMSDDEVICTSYYSKLNPLENGEIHTSLVIGRPGVTGPSDTLQEFTAARFVRLRMQRIRTLNADLMTLSSSDPQFIDKSVTRRYFYSIKDISIGGQCMCFGHARDCPEDPISGRLKCRCVHNTCGDSCERCCPLYNQKPWRLGTSTDAGICEKCQCYGHADECFYSPEVASRKESLNINGTYEGGGVCQDCKDFTMGINCEQCLEGYYRPLGVPRNALRPCTKCECDAAGAIGHCIKDDSRITEGYNPGDCICRDGFAGSLCDRCARGYRRYPYCEPCPCDFAGTVSTDCEGDCVCKKNVEGIRCDRCKDGHFSLDEYNPDGCTECFCFGLSNHCESFEMVAETIAYTKGWVVTDLAAKRGVRPTEDRGRFTIANDDMLGIDLYYWMAPKNFLGNKATAYGTKFLFSVSWVKARGDSAGRHTHGPDVVIEGHGMQIAYGNKTHHGADNSTKEVALVERDWYHLPMDGLVKSKRGKKIWAGPTVSRKDFMEVLHDIKRLLVRAKYHTDQIEGSLLAVTMEVGSSQGVGIRKLRTIEKCVCPPGFSGLSCELCEEGYRRVNNTMYKGKCEKCDCNNHARTCDPFTGECQDCQHNTDGMKCDKCLPGFFGNPTVGTPLDCQRCTCPLEDSANNFSPTCVALESTHINEFICDNCPVGYTGEKCQWCDDNYFGSPLVPGNFCQPCECNGNVDGTKSGNCDSITGQCLRCVANTGGWHCDECKDGFYGYALTQECRACECNLFGSLNSICDKISGQCTCKHNYVGKNCERCAEGYGNIADGCIPCSCNLQGSTMQRCDPVSAQCDCKPGVFGAKCDSCLDGYYGFSDSGCTWCGCDPIGAAHTTCDAHNGRCHCKANVKGRTCNQCKVGFYNLLSGVGCEVCGCDPIGAEGIDCDEVSGQCQCKIGVTGRACNRCRPNFFGFSESGCKRCEPCDAPGHLCHSSTGECVCPQNTEGRACEQCKTNMWGYDPLEGCKPCNCNVNGTARMQCDAVTGRCRCHDGYEGHKCNKCRYGYFEFPNCKKCRCHEEGTDSQHCNSLGDCECDDSGQCPCKANVEGKKCRRCKDGTFGLLAANPLGCFECFCFGKSARCMQSQFVWGQLTMSEERKAFIKYGELNLNTTNGLFIIPGTRGQTNVGLRYILDSPLYWELPDVFLDDKVLSYNGRLSFTVQTENGNRFQTTVLRTYPIVQLQGNFRIVLEHYADSTPPDGHYVVPLHEDYWKVKNNPKTLVTRSMMMVALQNLQYILIRASDSADIHSARLFDVTLDVAVPPSSLSPTAAIGVEVCECPPEYNGTSCQDPADGFYRKRKPNFLDSKDILDLVGVAVPCECSGRSIVCDKETGYCLNCEENTAGPYCNLCASGYFGDPAIAPCSLCACPTVDKSFSDSCMLDVFGGYVCTNCHQGYTGRHCEKCDHGFYGDPLALDGQCVSCNCDTRGSVGVSCDSITGQCLCLDGITGRDCSQCAPRHIITGIGCQTCDDGCVGKLLDDIDYLIGLIDQTNLTGVSAAPWTRLFSLGDLTDLLKEDVDAYGSSLYLARKLINDFAVFGVENDADMLFLKVMEVASKTAMEIPISAHKTKLDAEEIEEQIRKLSEDVDALLQSVWLFGMGSTDISVNVEAALAEAESLLGTTKSIEFRKPMKHAQKELHEAIKLLERVHALMLNHTRVDGLAKRLEGNRKCMDEQVGRITECVHPQVQRAQNLNKKNKERLQRAQDYSNRTESLKNDLVQTKYDSGELLNEAKDNLNLATENYGEIRENFEELLNFTDRVQFWAGILEQHNDLYNERYVEPANDKAAELKALADDIHLKFNATRTLAREPMEAVQVYQNIYDALIEAEQAAVNASKTAVDVYRLTIVADDLPITRVASSSKERSMELYQNAFNIEDVKLMDVRDKLEIRQKGVDNVLDLNSQLDKGLKQLLDRLKGPRESLRPKVNEVNANLKKVEGLMAGVNRHIDNIQDRISTELQKKMDALLAGTSDGLGHLARMIENATKNVTTSKAIVQNLQQRRSKLADFKLRMDLNLTSLRSKILRARQSASSIKISLSGKDGECVRSFRPDVEPSTTSNIILNYAISSDVNDSLLFYLANSKQKDYMAIEMVDRRVRFIWNAGGGVQAIEHPLRLETNDEDLLRNERWYKVEVTRINNIASLSVQPIPDTGLEDKQTVSNYSSPVFLRMDVDASSHFYIGGMPPKIKIPSAIKSRGFAGCLYELFLDGKRIGLWNFLTNKGCKGCKEGASEGTDSDEAYFNGDGYAIQPQIKRFTKGRYQVRMSFKSLDEDALLFFSSNAKLGHFISIELRNGSVLFQYHIGHRAPLIMKTNKKYNTGKSTRVTAKMTQTKTTGATGTLTVDDEESTEAALPLVGNLSVLLELKDSKIYFGGVPPDFPKKNWGMVGFNPFLGCMNSLQINLTPINVFRHRVFGIEAGCKPKAMKILWLKGNGYLEMNGQTLHREANFAFSFETRDADGLLMLSTFAGKEQKTRKQYSDFYSVSLVDGKIHCWINAGDDTLKIVAPNSTYNDGIFHTISVLKNIRKVELRVDDQSIQTSKIQSSSGAPVVESPEIGGLYFGGVPKAIEILVMEHTASWESIKGHIKDVVFNDKLLSFNEPVKFADVGIGRFKPNIVINGPFTPSPSMPKLEKCMDVSQYTIERRAMKFGDRPSSHAQLNVKQTARSAGFNISFEFRTYYPNGMLLFLKNGRKQGANYLVMAIRNGRIEVNVIVKGKQEEPISSQGKLNDGEWKKVVFARVKRALTLTVDNKKPKEVKLTRRLQVHPPLFIGGTSEATTLPENLSIEHFKGCVRYLDINGVAVDLARDKEVNTGQCFAKVERGAFFGGDAYAVYAENFSVGRAMEIELEFKTTRFNGILLSVSEDGGSRALALELHNGDVMMTVDLGDKNRLSASVNFSTQYYVCNNMWHMVKASYSEKSLTLKVDELFSSFRYRHSNDSLSEEAKTNGELFIGGLPDLASQGVLKSRSNFVGCIRNYVIKGERLDWTDMVERKNILLDSCPVE